MSSKTRMSRAMSALAASCLALTPACGNEAGDLVEVKAKSSAEATVADSQQARAVPDNYPSPGGLCDRGRPLDPRLFERIPLDRLERLIIQRLPRPTKVGEAFAVHVRVPPTGDPELERSLIRVAGSRESSILLFNSDALQQLGQLEKSPGPGFFTAFANIDQLGIERRQRLEREAARGPINDTALVFEGRKVVGVTSPVRFEPKLEVGVMVGLGAARLIPLSSPANWGEALFVTHPDVVTDPDRTRDTCTNRGNACGPWTFCHLMTEMANTARTGITPEAFTRQWLQQWLRDYTVNSDTVARRTNMWNTVILPWLTASGGQQLDLRRAPFRLLAIVNRLDLRQTDSSRTSRYGGGGGGEPINAGELRFVFGVMRPSTNGTACEPMPFTVIFEYGVPIRGCEGVRDWAQRWTALDAMGGFGPAYRAALESITESVVLANVEPPNGNGNAINQIRTNEIALASPWELREFTLANQAFLCDKADDVPSDGFLRPHTVAQTPDDGAHSPTANPIVDEYVHEDVVPPSFTCETGYEVPPQFDCDDGNPTPFLGANSLASLVPGGSPPGAWLANGPATGDFICGRHEFSLNTCNGCHTCDTDTAFTHVDPMSGIPAALSGFLTGTVVPDTQFPGVNWAFNDLDRRYQDLYDVAGSLCLPFLPVHHEIFPRFKIDPEGPIVINIDEFAQIFDARADLTQRNATSIPTVDDFARPTPNASH